MKRILILILIMLIAAGPGAAQAKKTEKPIRFTLSAAAMGLGIADVALTFYGCNRGLVESNRLMRPLIEGKHYFAAYSIQIVGTAAIIAALNMLICQDSKGAKIAGYGMLILVVAARTYFVVHNARMNRGLR